MKVAYFDCFGGASGDMIVGALLDAGVRLDRLRADLKRLALSGYSLSIDRVTRNGLAGLKFDVHMDDGSLAHTHAADAEPAHAHPHGHGHGHGHDHGHDHDHPHDHDHGHPHDHEHGHPHDHEDEPPHEHEHPHVHGRGLADILHLLDHADLPERTLDRARRVFRRLGQAEAKMHNVPVEQVHFHEVGAVDSIVDIVGACLALELLGVERILCSAIPLGTGTVRCAHGVMPVPAPATAELMRDGLVAPSDYSKELCTPTAAAILTTLAESFGPLPAMKVEAIGYGAGGRDDPGRANLMRVFVGEIDAGGQADTVVELHANVDDTPGQVLGAVVEMLLAAGALDAWTAPIAMKKSRPAVQIGVLCRPEDVSALERILFAETTTIGIRRHTCARTKLLRHHETVETPYGPVRVKVSGDGTTVFSAVPEFDDCLSAGRTHHVPIKEVQQAAIDAYRRGR